MAEKREGKAPAITNTNKYKNIHEDFKKIGFNAFIVNPGNVELTKMKKQKIE